MGSLLRKLCSCGQLAQVTITMLQKIFSLLLLVSVAYTHPAADPAAKADPQLLNPLVHTYGAPLVYHAANCTTEEEVIKIKKCQDVTVKHCTNGLVTINADETDKVKREAKAEADPQVYGLAPIVPLLKHTCVDTVQEHCIQEPKVT